MQARPDTTVHTPVMPREVLQGLQLQSGQVVVDGTVGAGGHSRLILPRLGEEGVLIGVDRDPQMAAKAAAALRECSHPGYVRIVSGSYAELPKLVAQLRTEDPEFAARIPGSEAWADRVLLDLGWSSDQLADPERGFGFTSTVPLDLRYTKDAGPPAWELLETVSEDELVRILRDFGEERFAARIAAAVVARRRVAAIRTGAELSQIVRDAVPAGVAETARKHPATRVFQALRIAVNRELEHLQRALHVTLPQCVVEGGLLAVISFHSLEDRIVKQAFRGPLWRAKGKPAMPTATEQQVNPRSRSARLRVAVRTATAVSEIPDTEVRP